MYPMKDKHNTSKNSLIFGSHFMFFLNLNYKEICKFSSAMKVLLSVLIKVSPQGHKGLVVNTVSGFVLILRTHPQI